MGKNAQRRRAAKDARRATRTKVPHKLLDMVDYISTRWSVSPKQARTWLFEEGKVNVNGSVYARPYIPTYELNVNEYGNYRIMVEGVPDPRPPRAVELKGKA